MVKMFIVSLLMFRRGRLCVCTDPLRRKLRKEFNFKLTICHLSFLGVVLLLSLIGLSFIVFRSKKATGIALRDFLLVYTGFSVVFA